ncbi:MAG TPA: hypothetical protein VFW15_05460 [Thermoanaerobaculia bacterium]|nr:hypothetical protein [Thermoanaerobaculia bacterium]
MPLRRRLSGVLSAAALVPPLVWFGPALVARLAPSFRDQGDFFYPLKLYTAARLRAGEIPFWNPLSGAGEPWLANGQAGVFYPATAFFLLPYPGAAAILFLLFHFGVAAWGMHRFLKQEGISDSGALFGAAVFASSGYAASLSAFWNHFGAWAWIPAIASVARSGLRSRGAWLALALLVGLQAMAGSPELTGMTLAVALVLSFRPRPDADRPWLESSRARTVLRTAGALLLGLAVAGWVLVPMGEAALHSDRRGALTVEEREPGAIPVPALMSALARPRTATPTFWLASLFVGPLALVVALAAFFERERRSLTLVLLGLALAGLVIAGAGPPGSWLRAIPPLDRIRYPEKALSATVFGLAALGGLGLDTLRFRAGRRWLRFVVPILGAGALLLALTIPSALELRAALVVGLLSAIALALGAGRRETVGGLLGGLAALALVAGYAVANRGLFRFVPEAEIRLRPPTLDAIGSLTGRVLTPSPQALTRWVVRDWTFDSSTVARQREALAGYTNLLFGISTVRTAAALPTRGARAIADSVDAAEDPVRAAGPASVRVLWSPFRPGPHPSRKVGELYRVPVAPYRPRLSFARSYRVEPDPARAWARAASGEVDLAREVVLDREPSPRPPAGARAPILVARLAEDLPERVVAEVATNSAGLLVVTDLFYPGWIAEEDGRRLEILRADGFFRAVALPAGSHRVTFRYRPRSALAGAALTALALLTILVLAYQGEPVRVGRRR